MYRLVICRRDLPENPRWREENYPDSHCWSVLELFTTGENNVLIRETANRIKWECYWRLMRHYHHRHKFFDTYLWKDGEIVGEVASEESPQSIKDWICKYIFGTAIATGYVPPEHIPSAYELLFRRRPIRGTPVGIYG